jgi:hypothetical protein
MVSHGEPHRRSGSPAPSCLSPLDDGTPFLILGDPLPLLPSNITWGPNQALELHLLGTMLPSIPSSSIRMQTVLKLLSLLALLLFVNCNFLVLSISL